MAVSHILQYKPGNPPPVSLLQNATLEGTCTDLNIGVTASGFGLLFSPDGTKLLTAMDGPQYGMDEWNLSPAWDLSSNVHAGNNVFIGVSDSPILGGSVTWRPDGLRLFGLRNPNVFMWDMANAHTLTGMNTTKDAIVNIATMTGGTVYESMTLSLDGTKLYAGSNASDVIDQFTMSTPWDLTTLSYDSVQFDVSGQMAIMMDFIFKSDGKKMLALDSGTSMYEYDLGTAWDISTMSYSGYSIADTFPSGAGTGTGLAFAESETKVVVLHNQDLCTWTF